MPFKRRTLSEWDSIGYNEFLRIYSDRQYQLILRYIERRIKSDLIRILASTGLMGDVYFIARIKKPYSTFEKLPRMILQYREKRKNKPTKLLLHQIIRDVVGIRVICIDTNSAANILRRIVMSDTLEVDETCEFYRLVEGSSNNLSDVLKPIFADGLFESKKPSGYESVHLEVYFFGALDKYKKSLNSLGPVFSKRMEEINALRRQMTEETASHISSFPIEVQIRTFTQHIWARDEQKVIYSAAKSGRQYPYDIELTRTIKKEFLNLKKALNRAESIRARIQCIDLRRVKNNLRFVGKSYEINSRLGYFEQSNFKQYIESIKLIESKLSDLKLSPPDSEHGRFADKVLDVVKNIVSLCIEISQSSGEEYFTNATGKLSDSFWGRQRVILLIVGYLLLFSDDRTLKQIINYLLNYTKFESILGIGKNVDFGLTSAARVYEHILIRDRMMSNNMRSKFRYIFQDPLVYSRLASARYVVEDYYGAANCMKELFNTDWWSSFWSEKKHKNKLDVPELYQYHLRYAEYLWYYGYRMGERNQMYEKLVDELKYCMTSNGGMKDAKVLCWTILLNAIMHGNEESSNDLSRMAEKAKKILAELEELECSRLMKKAYYVAALAVIQFHGKQRSKGVKLLNDAREILKNGIPHPKGAIAIGLQMCDEIGAALSVKS